MDVEDIDPVQTKPAQAFLHRAHHTVVGEIEHRIDRRHALVCLPRLGRRAGPHEPAYFRGEHELVARLRTQHRAQSQLGEAVPIERGGIEEADARLPSGLDHAVRLVVGNRLEQAAQGCGAQAKSRDLQRGRAELDPFQSSQILRMRSLPSPLKSCVTAIIVAISASHSMLVGSFAISAIARS